MYKLCVVLGWSALKKMLKPPSAIFNPYGDLEQKIRQHRIVMSDEIDRYYTRLATEDGLLDEYQSFHSSLGSFDVQEEIEDLGGSDINKSISSYLKNKCKVTSIIICENKELKIAKKACKYQYTMEDIMKDKKGPLALYSVTCILSVEENANATPYIEWIKNMISEEKVIHMVDPYLLKAQRNYDCLVNHYFPILPNSPDRKKRCTVHLHVSAGSPFIDDARSEAKKYHFELVIHTYSDMCHDRYIITGDRIIMIGIGMDFMKGNDDVVTRDVVNFAVNERNRALEAEEEENRLIGGKGHLEYKAED